MRVKRLFVYPIKSLLPVEVQQATITEAGFRFDRQFILIDDVEPDENGISKHITIKTTSELCLFHQSIDEETERLTITYRLGDTKDSITVPLAPPASAFTETASFRVDLFTTQADGQDVGPATTEFFSKYLHRPVRLLYIGSGGCRNIPFAEVLVPRKVSRFPLLFKEQVHPQRIRYADAAPLLLTTTASEEEARSRLPKQYQDEDIITRFRPNIHVDTSSSQSDEAEVIPPWAEDDWKRISIFPQAPDSKALSLDCVFRTPRCQSLNVDFETGKLVPPERQLFGLLAKDRRINPLFPAKPCFGTYCFAEPIGTVVHVGDDVNVDEFQKA